MFFCNIIVAQNTIDIKAIVDVETKTISILQTIVYKNESNDTLSEIFLNDWNNSYSTKSTPLAKRFEEEFSTKFHLAKSEQRGYTIITSIKDKANQLLEYNNLNAYPDVIKVILKNPLLPGDSYNLSLNYNLIIPDATFTDYGFTKSKNFDLKYWYITPTVYNGKWNYYSNKNLDDLFIPKADISISITHPLNYRVTSELDFITLNPDRINKRQTTILYGKDRIDTYLSLNKFPRFSQIQTDDFIVISNIYEKGLPIPDKALLTDKITRFLSKNLGEYPHRQLLLTNIDYNKNQLYCINQYTDFLKHFQQTIK